ncbi:hypothetical protein WJX72_005406 [[Myrmecia] bisecta]|uniref:Fe2OG dioxygenase domain-containing protein n=1 Tax=[Myrmecia] bisecta TaxID=41462 RepID=A0AAW1PW85_9CHLO
MCATDSAVGQSAAAHSNTTTTSSIQVPVIDAGSCFAPDGPQPSAELSRQIREACEQWGFFQLINHGVSPAYLQRQHEASGTFFSLPLDLKLQCKRSADNARGYFNDELTKQVLDLKEGFDFGHKPHPELPDDHPHNRTLDGCNRWPGGQDDFKAIMTEYYEEMARVSFRLLEIMCMGLGLPPTALHHFFQGAHTSFLRLNYYPPVSAQQAQQQLKLGINPHKDAGFLTVLVQDDVPGLQVYHDRQWHTVQPIPGAFVINVGDMCQVLTNDKFNAPLHRVVAPAGRERYSAPFFFNPAYAANHESLECCIDTDHPRAYRTLNWGDFRSKRFQGDYADVGEEVQIEHYRLSDPSG